MDVSRRPRCWLVAFLLLLGLRAATAQTEPTVVAQGAAVIDSQSGEFLFQKNADAREYPASSTKILTALIIIESGDLDRVITILPEDTKVEPSSLGFRPGDQYSRRQLLFGLMLKSANDAALALARDNAGGVGAFADKMNQRAMELGANESHFVNPHGLHDPNHFTTAHDLALIARAAMQQPFFRQVVRTIYYSWVYTNGRRLELINHNRLLRHFAGCNGLKTGYTRPAQQVLVSSALREDREVISVVLHTDKPGIWVDSKNLLIYGLLRLGCPAEAIGDTTDRADEPGQTED
jgi:serine-type D-Ala-D-Ala carboxypeptidase (penicillin-binding protein 5/6)